jgi:hypothetical protein
VKHPGDLAPAGFRERHQGQSVPWYRRCSMPPFGRCSTWNIWAARLLIQIGPASGAAALGQGSLGGVATPTPVFHMGHLGARAGDGQDGSTSVKPPAQMPTCRRRSNETSRRGRSAFHLEPLCHLPVVTGQLPEAAAPGQTVPLLPAVSTGHPGGLGRPRSADVPHGTPAGWRVVRPGQLPRNCGTRADGGPAAAAIHCNIPAGVAAQALSLFHMEHRRRLAGGRTRQLPEAAATGQTVPLLPACSTGTSRRAWPPMALSLFHVEHRRRLARRQNSGRLAGTPIRRG